ncbi:hypothetical protein BC833DRAFT_365730 [Globomyces pollinis-pini]|nr:hypothetical protein BC833DRAFT_365730 [Globomyces pollinis-pini]
MEVDTPTNVNQQIKDTNIFFLVLEFFGNEQYKSTLQTISTQASFHSPVQDEWIPLNLLSKLKRMLKLIDQESDIVHAIQKFNCSFFELTQTHIKRVIPFTTAKVKNDFLTWNVLTGCSIQVIGFDAHITIQEVQSYFIKFGTILSCHQSNESWDPKFKNSFVLKFENVESMKLVLLKELVYDDEPLQIRMTSVEEDVTVQLIPTFRQNRILGFTLSGNVEFITKQHIKKLIEQFSTTVDVEYNASSDQGAIFFKKSVANDVLKIVARQDELVIQEATLKLAKLTVQQELFYWSLHDSKDKVTPQTLVIKSKKVRNLEKKQKQTQKKLGKQGKGVEKKKKVMDKKTLNVNEMDKLIASFNL